MNSSGTPIAIRAYVIWTHPLFRDLAMAVMDFPEICWVGSSSDLEAAVDELTILQPELVLVEDEVVLLEIISKLSKFPEKAKFLSMNMTDNQMILYNREQCFIQDIEELRKLILDPILD